MKETSGTGYLRAEANPNRRAQDGLKEYWLCAQCEALFSQWETVFARELFYPVANDAARGIQYRGWLLKFCVSMSWRVLTFIQEHGRTDHLPPELVLRTNIARDAWASFLLGAAQNPGAFEQHILLLDVIERHQGGSLPPNINRYLLRSVDIDVAGSSNAASVYVKLPHVIIIGVIDIPSARKWRGTKVHVNKGTAGPRATAVDATLFQFIVDRARRFQTLPARISEAQRDKIDKSFLKNLARIDQTGSFKAMVADIRLFGDAAFTEPDET